MSTSCPYCRTVFEADDEVVACPGCDTRHHADCLAENGGCTIFGCSEAPAEEPKISVSDQDLTTGGRTQLPAMANPASFLNIAGTDSPMEISASVPGPTPPPPRPDGAPPPPRAGLIHSSHPAEMVYPTFGGYAPAARPINPFEPRKSRVVFVLLAVFLGAFGGHNFYAGYVKKAVIQLCLTALTCFFGALISWPWAIVEACVINQDDDGVAFV